MPKTIFLLEIFLILLMSDNLKPSLASYKSQCINEEGHVNHGALYPVPGDCTKFYQCDAIGVAHEFDCPQGLVFNPLIDVCDWPHNVVDCGSESSSPSASNDICYDVDDNQTTFFNASTCKYLRCKDGASQEIVCPNEMVYDPKLGFCVWSKNVSVCEPDPNQKDPILIPSLNCEEDNKKNLTEEFCQSNSEQNKTGKSFIGFVIDESGSMKNEVEGVKEWLNGCVNGSYSECASAPTGGWLLGTFSDPDVGDVIGPTTDLQQIVVSIKSLDPNGGGDCPEKAFAGVLNVVSAVEDQNSGCKIFFISDAIPNDDSIFENVEKAFVQKGCQFVPILTGCCGECNNPCESVDDEYCANKVFDSTTYSSDKKKDLSREEKYYILASETNGAIHITDKPKTSRIFYNFLQNQIKLGFCSSNLIAGPLPNGFQNEKECLASNSCWDVSTASCYCS